jgi:hypothetical protein
VAAPGASPKSLDERYEALAGDEDERVTRYLFRRHLGVGATEYDAMPWWERRLYIEGLVREFPSEEEVDD